jgi:NAD(P)-dependent dehydrogenase (short-subunit alcohol dehydrogenase family)
MRFQDKVAIVAGGGGGIGRAISAGLGVEGAQVVIWDTYEIGGMQTVEQIKVSGGKALSEKVDVTQYGQVKDASQRVIQRFGQVDILVVTVGGGVFKFLKDMPAEFWRQQVNYNIKTVFNCSHAVAPHMIQRNYGKILNFLSTTGGTPGLAGYGAGKAGVVALTKTLAGELAQHKINVNAMGPGGVVLTPLTLGAYAAMPGGIQMMEQQLKMMPRGANTPEWVAKVALFMVSDDAERLSGQLIN